MLPAFASIDDLVARMGSVADETRAQAALDDVSSEIRDVAGKSWVNADGDLDLPTEENSTVADTLLRICCAAARRVLENPEGLTQESIGSYSATIANGSADVYLTSAERRAVRRAAGKGSIGAIPLSRGPLETRVCADTQYLPVEPSGQAIPFAGPEGY